MQPQDPIDAGNSPINAEPQELTMLRFELAEVEKRIEELKVTKIYGTRTRLRLLFVNNVKRDAIKAQIKAWNESDLGLPY